MVVVAVVTIKVVVAILSGQVRGLWREKGTH